MKTLLERCRTSRWCWAVLLSLVLGAGLLAWFMIPGRLGEEARSGVPALVEIANQKISPMSQSCAIMRSCTSTCALVRAPTRGNSDLASNNENVKSSGQRSQLWSAPSPDL
jgi:hypothetical protein